MGRRKSRKTKAEAAGKARVAADALPKARLVGQNRKLLGRHYANRYRTVKRG